MKRSSKKSSFPLSTVRDQRKQGVRPKNLGYKYRYKYKYKYKHECNCSPHTDHFACIHFASIDFCAHALSYIFKIQEIQKNTYRYTYKSYNQTHMIQRYKGTTWSKSADKESSLVSMLAFIKSVCSSWLPFSWDFGCHVHIYISSACSSN